jgi:lipopolysaccharide transport system permease protein
MVAVFTFVFGEIFQSKWVGTKGANHIDFATALFSGLLIYNLFSECIGKASHLITSNPNYVKKIIFPLEVLSIVTVLAALFHFLVAYTVIVILVFFSGWTLTWSALYTPIIVLPLLMLIVGFTWVLSALGVFLRDIGQIISPMLTAMMFLSPIFYPLSSVSPKLQWLYHLNPITLVVENLRGALLHQKTPNWLEWFVYTLVCACVMMTGFLFFQRPRKGFSDVI